MSALQGAVVLVTGANGGLGTHFVHQALDRGAAKVYAAARTPRDWAKERVVPLRLDVTDAAPVRDAAAAASDVPLGIHNATGRAWCGERGGTYVQIAGIPVSLKKKTIQTKAQT